MQDEIAFRVHIECGSKGFAPKQFVEAVGIPGMAAFAEGFVKALKQNQNFHTQFFEVGGCLLPTGTARIRWDER